MTDPPVIVTEHLTKVYRLYERPQQRILSLLGLNRGGKYTDHYAVDDVSISVRRGERLGIIGRNGAGKSTLLKLLSGVTPPTSGTVRVDGQARALLEIGTGFHPEFTGRDNAKAYFAQLGVAGRQVGELVDQVIEFSELEEYIDQPLKTYSTGMRLRLMFATATVVAPDILVLDEVLGVGDAYFTRKSFDRINEMARRDGATLLLVSHDIYTSARICERMIWLESGKLVFDGDPKEAVRAYEDSIRLQEEARLRSKSLMALKRHQRAERRDDASLYVEIASPDGQPLAGPVWLGSVRLVADGDDLVALPISSDASDGSSLDFEGTCWGDVAEWNGARARPMKDFGSPFHRVAGTLVPASESDLHWSDLGLALDLGADTAISVLISVRSGDRLLARHNVTVGGHGWEHFVLPVGEISDDADAVEPAPQRSAVFGTGRIRVVKARLLDSRGLESFTFWHGDTFTLSFDYEIRDPDLDENCDIAISIQRGGVETACRVFTRSLHLSFREGKQGSVQMTIGQLMLGAGAYSVTVQVARPGYYDREGDLFYTINPDVHLAVRQLVDFEVKARGAIAESTSWVADAAWELGETAPLKSEHPE